jgi:hypothetical protein
MTNDLDSTAGDGFGKDDNSDNSKHNKKKKKDSSGSNNSSASDSSDQTVSDADSSLPKQQQQQQSKAAKSSINKNEPSVGRSPSGAYKGASISSNSYDNNTKNHNSGHPRSMSNNTSDNNSNSNSSKKANNDGAKSTPMKHVKKNSSTTTNNNTKKKNTANNNSIVSNGSGSSIKSSDKNTSLTGFKSSTKQQQQPSSSSSQQPRQQQQQQNQQGGSSSSPGNPKLKNIDPNDDGGSNNNNSSIINNSDNNVDDVTKRIIQLETIVSAQMSEIQKLRREIDNLTKSAVLFTQVVEVLRNAGIQIDEDDNIQVGVVDIDNNNDDDDDDDEDENDDTTTTTTPSTKRIPPTTTTAVQQQQKQMTFNDDLEIFGITPKSVTDAADTAGASMLSAILAGKHRMLVDVRDAELTRDPKLLVEFIELAILPVAAGLEGLDYVRNRVKIVFPTVRELMSYRKLMALAAPEVVSLSTLGFEPVDERDNLIVVIAPSPDDVAGVAAMEKLIARTDKNYVEPHRRILQPVVVMNHHMVPVDMAGFAGQFTTVYHLRLLSVQYMTGDAKEPEFVTAKPNSATSIEDEDESSNTDDEDDDDDADEILAEKVIPGIAWNQTKEEEEALEAAMTHAHEIGFHQGVTRAMVIRAYPKPWHVFVDTSPDTDADFEVAATFDTEPTQEDVNYAIVECLEGSEREDEIVAQQMQAALEAGQLNRVSEMLGITPSDMVSSERTFDTSDTTDTYKPYQEYDGKDWDDLYYDDWFSEDSV